MEKNRKNTIDDDWLNSVESKGSFNSDKMRAAKFAELRLLKEQLDLSKEQSMVAERNSKRMFIIAIGSLVVTAFSVIIPLFFRVA